MAATLKTDRLQNKTDTTDNIFLNSSGATTFGGAVDINSGAIDGTTVGAASASTGAFTNVTATNIQATSGQPLSIKEDGGTTILTVEADGDVVVNPASASAGTISVGSDVRQSMIMDAKTAGTGHQSGVVSAGVGLGVGSMYAGITGEIKMFGGSSEPEGWVFCDGSIYDGASGGAYYNLKQVIGTTYGAGGGGTNFNVPDLRGRVPAGMDDMDGSAGTGGGNAGRLTTGTLGASGGVESHTLTASESGTGTHEHTVPGTTTNSQSTSTTSGGSAHSHGMRYSGPDTGYNYPEQPYTGNTHSGDMANTQPESSHTHSYGHTHGTPSRATTSVQTGSAASAHTNLQPYLCINYIIKL